MWVLKKFTIINFIIWLNYYKKIIKPISTYNNTSLRVFNNKDLYVYNFWALKNKKYVPNSSDTYKLIYWVSWFLNSYLHPLLHSSLYWKFVNISVKNHLKIFINFWKKTYRKSFLKFFKTSAWYHYYLLVQVYFTRSITDFSKLVQLVLNKSSLKKHKKLIYISGYILITFFNFLQNINRIKGFNIYFKGKLGRKGSVKKSTIYIHRGKKSLSSKCLKYSYRNFLVFTETGVVGCYFSIFFNKMFTLVILYLINYVILYLLILYFIVNILNLNLSSNISLNVFISFCRKYFTFNPIMLILLILSGLPPFSFFIIKVNILMKILENNSVFIILLIFVNFLLTMFFYLQFFKLNNIKSKLNIKKQFNFEKSDKSSLIHYYNFTYTYILYMSINSLFIYIFTDCYIILESFLIKCQQKIKV